MPNRGSLTKSDVGRAPAQPARVNRPCSSLIAGPGQAGRSRQGRSSRSGRVILASPLFTYGVHPLDPQRDAPRRLALHVEQPAPDHLLGPQGDVGGGRVGVGAELGPADAVSGRHRGDEEPVVPCRGGARHLDSGTGPDPSQRPWWWSSGRRSGRASAGRTASTARRPSRPRRAPACPGIEHAAGDRHPRGQIVGRPPHPVSYRHRQQREGHGREHRAPARPGR